LPGARLHVGWTRPNTIHLWAFDLLAFNGRDLRPQPLVKRQARLQALLERFGCPAVRPSETFMVAWRYCVRSRNTASKGW
jgi:ATP-dependent DNA ligase